MEKEIKDSTEQFILRRNRRLKEWVEKYLPSAYVAGTKDAPMVIYKNKCLSLYCKNFDVIFMDSPEDGSEVYRIKLLKEYDPNFDLDGFIDWVNIEEFHRTIYRVELAGQDLFLSGYNFLDRENFQGKYPVFSKYNVKFYFSEEYAQSIVDTFNDYNLKVI